MKGAPLILLSPIIPILSGVSSSLPVCHHIENACLIADNICTVILCSSSSSDDVDVEKDDLAE